MLNNENLSEKLDEETLDAVMAVLQALRGPKPLPVGLRSKLKQWMELIRPEQNDDLELQDKIPGYAYFVARGFIYVTYLDEHLKQHIKRFYRKDRIVAFRSFLEQIDAAFTITAGRDTVLARISIAGLRDIYEAWPEMEAFANSVVMQYDELKEDLRTKLLCLEPLQRVKAFYRLYKCLLPAKLVRLDELIAQYLGVSERTLVRGRVI